MTTPGFDSRQVRRAFSRASKRYGAAATLQHEVEARLLDSLDYLDDRVPDVVLDLGSGPASAAMLMRQRFPRARIVAMDLSLAMLRQAEARVGGRVSDWIGRRRPLDRVNADARALPLADGSVDVLFCNLCLQWVDDLPAVFAGFRRVLKPEGMLLCSTFGADTLHELRDAFAQVDEAPHVSPFASIATFGDALMRAGFRNPVLDRDVFVQRYASLPTLMRELRAIGATNAMAARRHTLTGKARLASAAHVYAQRYGEPVDAADAALAVGNSAAPQLPATWEVIYAVAWSPLPGAPIRDGGFDVTAVPVSSIRTRKKPA